MDILNNLGVIIGIITGIFGIGGYIIAITGYFRNKAASSQRKQTAKMQSPQKQYSYQQISKSLSKLDWMQILWNGVEDFFRAYLQRDFLGCGITIGTAIAVGITIAILSILISPTAFYITLSICVIFFLTIHLLFYVYFVGRRIEEKVSDINQPLTQRARNTSNY